MAGAFQGSAFQASAFQGEAATRVAAGRRKDQFVADVIWPNDPRHPDYVAAHAPIGPVTPASNVIKVRPRPVAARSAAETTAKAAPTDHDLAVALLLLAA